MRHKGPAGGGQAPPKRPGGQVPPKRPGGRAPPKRSGGQVAETAKTAVGGRDSWLEKSAIGLTQSPSTTYVPSRVEGPKKNPFFHLPFANSMVYS